MKGGNVMATRKEKWANALKLIGTLLSALVGALTGANL